MSIQRPQKPIESIVPDNFVEIWDKRSSKDIETIEEALRAAERAPTTTPRRELRRCVGCGSVRIEKKCDYIDMPHQKDGDYTCQGCSEHFDSPLPPLSEFDAEEPVCPECGSFRIDAKLKGKIGCRDCDWIGEQAADAATDDTAADAATDELPAEPFEWLAEDDLADPSDRGPMPVLFGLDKETLTELAIRLHKPWDQSAGLSYRKAAQIFPFGHCWVGERNREWKDGEHRQLVPGPFPETVDNWV